MRRFTRTLALILVFSMVLGYLPQNLVFANLQASISKLSMEFLSAINTLRLTWDHPKPIEGTLTGDTTATHDVAQYVIYARNDSDSQPYQAIATVGSDVNRYDLPITDNIFRKDKGSFYRFRVLPMHRHIDNERETDVYAATSPEAFYLTDLKVTAEGTFDKLTVTWDNPQILKEAIITGYNIYYGKTDVNTVLNDPPVRVDITNPRLTTNTAGQYVYDIVGQFEIFQDFSVRVEPLVVPLTGGNAIELRNYNKQTGKLTASVIKEIKIGDTTYPLLYSLNDYSYKNIVIKPSLEITEVNNMIKVSWPSLVGIYSSNASSDKIVNYVRIYQSDLEDFNSNETVITTLSGYQAEHTNFILVPKPADNSELYFRIELQVTLYGNEQPPIFSDPPAVYSPSDIEYSAYKPEIYTARKVTTTDELSYEILWEAFPPDPDMRYEIAISDRIDDLDYWNTPTITLESATDLDVENYQDKVAYKHTFPGFPYLTTDGIDDNKTFEENKIYYIKITAIRNSNKSMSQPAYYSWYIPADVAPTTPVQISKPPLRVVDIGEDNFTIQWDKKWFEVYDLANEQWSSVIGLDSKNNIVFNEADAVTKVYLNELDSTLSIEEVRNRIKTRLLGIDDNKLNLTPVRQMDITDSQYAIHVVQFDTLFEKGGYDDYYKKSLELKKENTNWQFLGPLDQPVYNVKNEDAPKKGALSSNTAYVIYFVPFIDINGVYYGQYPNYLVVTTNATKPPLDIDPTVPTLVPISTTDVTATVSWTSSPGLKYELRYSELIADYKDGGTLIEIAANNDSGDAERKLTIEGLFPNTKYYFWIRAVSDKSTGRDESAYSNPIDMTTKDIEAPRPPQGLGLVSTGNLEIYNAENDLEYLQTDYDYIIVEWLRNYDDSDDTNANNAGAGAGGDAGQSEILSSPMFDVSYIVKFNQLTANRPYYVRVKVKATVTDGTDGIIKTFSYIVQIADNEEFLDAYEIEVPAVSAATGGNKFIQKESDWCGYIKVFTKPSKGEFDGDKNDALYPLPTNDFEITYDAATGTLTYRFRSNKTDNSGSKDNMVDQRFISSLVKSNAFSYYIDLSSYGDRKIQNRKIELPYSIVKAFDDMKINLEVVSNNLSITFYPKWLQTPQVTALSDFGLSSTVYIDLSESASKINAEIGGSYVSTPQQLSVKVATPTRTQVLDTTATQIGVSLKLNNRYATYDKNVLAYQYTDSAGAWQMQDSTYDALSGQTSFKTLQLGSYSAIAKNTPITASNHYADSAMRNFATKMTATDMAVYNGSAAINGNQLNNLVAAIAAGKKQFEINGYLPTAEQSALSKRKLIVETDRVTREQGIDSLVKLYEIKAGSAIKNYSSMTSTPYVDIATADSAYRNSLLKAGDLGFFAEGTANPKATMTLGDAIYIADLILQDFGM